MVCEPDDPELGFGQIQFIIDLMQSLSRASLDEMWRAVVPLDKARQNDGAMGLSFFLYTRGSEPIVGHTGSQAGFRAFLWFNPRTKRVVIAAYNTSSETTLLGADQAERALNDAVFRYLEKAP